MAGGAKKESPRESQKWVGMMAAKKGGFAHSGPNSGFAGAKVSAKKSSEGQP